MVTSALSDFTGENVFAELAEVETTVDVLRHPDAIPVWGAVEMVDVEVVLASTECQHGTNLLPIGSSPMPSCIATFPTVFAKLLQSGSKPFVNLTGGWAMSGKNCGQKNRGTGWRVVDEDWVGNIDALNTAGDDICHGLNTPLLATDTEANVPCEVSVWLPTT